VLERGSLFIRVENGASQAAPLRVVLPDGELEDIGTVFTVRVEAGRTARVSVREGSVLLRIRGEPARVVRAGETWLRDVPSTALAPAADTAESAPRAVAATAVAAPTAPAQGAPVRHSFTPADPARDFGAAIALLEAGKNREAAAAFARFAARHRRDARAEDATYLRVLALQRAESSVEVEAAAQQYLRDYPAGLRRLEVEELLRR
jgi:TolA-binding protein